MPQFQQWFIDLTIISANLFVIVTAIVAIISLSTWRKELLAKAKYDVAKKIVLIAYKFQAEVGLKCGQMELAKRISIFTNRSPRGKKLNRVSEFLSSLEDITPIVKVWEDLMEACWEAEVVLGDDLPSLDFQFLFIMDDILAAFHRYLPEESIQSGTSNIDYRKEKIEHYQDLVSGDLNKKLVDSTDTALKELKVRLKSYLFNSKRSIPKVKKIKVP